MPAIPGLTLPTVNLTSLQNQVTSSVSSLTNLSGQLSSQVSSLSGNVASAIGGVQSNLTNAISGLSSAASSIGTAITGASVSALPSMAKTIQGLVPDLGGLQNSVTNAISAVSSSILPTPPFLSPILEAIGKEVKGIQEKVTEVVSSVMAETQGADSEYVQILTETVTLEAQIADYDEAMAAYVFDPVNNPLPDPPIAFSIDATMSAARNAKDSSVDLTTGTMSYIVYKAAGITREISARMTTKTMLYDRAVNFSGELSRETMGNAGRLAAQLKSTTPEQSEGV